MQKDLPLQLSFLIADARLEIKRESYRSFVRAEQPINRFERNRFKVVTVERRRGIVSRVHVLAAGFVNTGQAFFRMGRICHRKVVVCIDVVVIQIQRDLKVVGNAVFKLLTKINHAIAAVFLLPTRRDPLLKFAMSFWCKVSGVGPGKNRLMRVRAGNAKQKRGQS